MRLATTFPTDLDKNYRWYLYGTRDPKRPIGDPVTGDERPPARGDEIDARSFGRSYYYTLSLRRGFEKPVFLNTRSIPPIETGGSEFYFYPDSLWYPDQGDLIFDVEWNCAMALVPQRGQIEQLLNIYEVVLTGLRRETDDPVYWNVFGYILDSEFRQVSEALTERWAAERSTVVGRTARYQRSV